MAYNPKTIMVFAVHHNRVGFVYMLDRQPMDWQMSYKAATTFGNAEKQISKWLDIYSPDLVLTEHLASTKRKGDRAKGLLEVIKRTVDRQGCKQEKIARRQPFGNKYEQISALCEEFPQMKAVVPKKRKYHEKEPPYVTLFEALAMAVDYLQTTKPATEPPQDLPV